MSADSTTNFYCSQKFTWLSVDVEKHLSYSCCTAIPEKLDINWLKNNPGNIFNTPGLHQDRIDMLTNQPVASCSESCWKPESKGLASRRTKLKSHTYIDRGPDTTSPTDLNLQLGSTCNLTCSYCCKQYSSAWYKDIDQQGPYLDYENRYKLIPEDRLVRKISQHDLQESDTFQVLINEMTKLDQVERITVSGGEPFLYNQFPDLLNTFDRAPSVIFYTGLGVDHKRLAKQISRIHIRNNLQVVVSAENCGNLYEFNRYSNTYENFLRNLEILVSAGFNITFNSVLSNLTLFGILEFAETFSQYPIVYSFCNSPDFLAVNVLDDSSKSALIDLFNQVRISESDLLISSLQQPCTDTQKKQFAQFLIEFSRRRNLSLDIFPTSMLKWLEI